jgi:putative flavoprotein involved in K+ transport
MVSVVDRGVYARHVVVATGPFQRPRVPEFSGGIPPSVFQTTAASNARPQELPDGAC